MKTQLLGRSPLLSTRLSYGCMRLLPWNPKECTPERDAAAKKAIQTALDSGYTLFDHADIYGAGQCERVFGDFLAENPAVRSRILIATKCGIRFDDPHRYDFSAKHILWSCEQSLKRLRTDVIDLYQLHRPDVLMNPPEIAGAFDQLRKQGKVREFGVSNFKPSHTRALQAHLPFPLAVNQVQIHLADLHTFTDGTLDQCLEMNLTPLAWSPIAGGLLATGGAVAADNPRHAALSKVLSLLDGLAKEFGVSRTVISLAWLMKHPTGIIPIVGSVKPENIRDMAKADGIDLSREQWYRLYVAARGENLP